MRFESKDFIKSQRQWRESRESKTNNIDNDNDNDNNNSNSNGNSQERVNGNRNSRTRKTVSYDARIRRTTQLNKNYDHHRDQLPKRSIISVDDARDDIDLDEKERNEEDYAATFPDANNPNTIPPDFSRKELEQLVRSKQKRIQKATAVAAATEKTANASLYEEYTEGIRQGSVKAFLNAHDKVKRSNRENGVENSRDMDGMLLYMLPSHVWFGDFLNGSQDALNKIQKRMMLHYSSDKL